MPLITSPTIITITKETKQSQYTARNKKCTRSLCQQQRPRKNFSNPNFKIFSPNNVNIKRLRKAIEKANRYWIDPFRNVINLSKFSFWKYQNKLLNKNLNFCPTPERYKKNEVINDFKEFKKKKVKLKAFYALQENHDISQLNYKIPKKYI